MRITIILISLLFGAVLFGQPLRTVPYDLQIETANEQMELKNYPGALEWFTKAYKDSKDKAIAAKIAEINYLLRDYKRAEGYYKRLLGRDRDSIFTEYTYDYGKTLKALGQFKDAANMFAIFRDYTDDEVKKADALRELKGMQKANQLPDNIETVMTFAGKNVNTASAENSPKFYNGALYFGAIQSKKAIETDGNNEDQFARIYKAEMGDEGYDKAEALGDHINRPGYHTSNPSFTKDGRYMFFTRTLLLGNEIESSDIYMSKSTGDGWSPAIEVEGLNGDYIISHPVPGELFGNEVLFFSSDMDGGLGGMDIYYATMRSENEFSESVNLGPGVNSAKDEVTPFYLDGTLYYSSDGLEGLGGLDAYKTVWDGTKWSTAVNMGHQYNTTYDDLYLSFDGVGENGFIVSNRPDEDKRKMKSETCCDDIYQFYIKQVVVDLLALLEDDNGPLAEGRVTLIDKATPETPDDRTNSLGNEFRFLLESDRSYKAIATREGYYPDTIEFNTAGILDNYTVRKTIKLKPIPPAEAEPEFEEVTINQPIRLNNIYYDFEKWDILPDAEKDLGYIEELMDQYPDMVIELSSHTDARGGKRYNLNLSQKRAQSAKDWLVSRGITDGRIKAVGYGESRIINRCGDRVKCSEEEHQVNRRTEFKIIAGPETIQIKKEILKGAVRQN